MDEFIERKALREAFENANADVVEEYEDGQCDWGFGRQNILEVINSVPAADVSQVRHGRWKRYGKNLGECSECGEIVSVRNNYCPNCGAKMDGEQ